ncbi:hypothetical protein PHYSODRAFT_358131 [Phytophthora sojae]|uniref:Uncharacterized protein n=1 Tax=Phytophthora sojae (strain P6497) TaxID=1094619 RepID=G4YGK7_PHYSP|nr:hypothetical protein PHYSODRAFT_358131 [Phytophthora sojae]EGZ26542.1 hypothetical protein PHYSODRAFT_358131 [Phytophthora sojae]|eukprot:XP_009513817.1 hypothetical protein PHYSODRAFT_358131 [Phytophthora sojae]
MRAAPAADIVRLPSPEPADALTLWLKARTARGPISFERYWRTAQSGKTSVAGSQPEAQTAGESVERVLRGLLTGAFLAWSPSGGGLKTLAEDGNPCTMSGCRSPEWQVNSTARDGLPPTRIQCQGRGCNAGLLALVVVCVGTLDATSTMFKRYAGLSHQCTFIHSYIHTAVHATLTSVQLNAFGFRRERNRPNM